MSGVWCQVSGRCGALTARGARHTTSGPSRLSSLAERCSRRMRLLLDELKELLPLAPALGAALDCIHGGELVRIESMS